MRKSRMTLVIVALLVFSLSLYAIFFLSAPQGRAGAYKIDLAGMRAMAGSEGPAKIEALVVGEGAFPAAAVLSGWSFFTKHPMVFTSYGLRYDDQRVVLDTALDQSMHEEMFPGNPFYNDRYEIMQQAMLDASKHKGVIMLTHEHPDHIGGLARSPFINELARVSKLTLEQLTGPSLTASHFPDEAKKNFTPFIYDGLASPAPGVVVAKAPGHSPGSQLVYVALRNGTEYLFVGDIAWTLANIETGIGRPLLISLLFLHEDRQAVADQLVALKALQEAEPKLHIVIAHDAAQLDDMILSGLISEGFSE